MKDDELYVKHVLEAVQVIEDHLGEIERDSFMESKLVQDAVIRELEIIGEAAKRLSDDFKEKHADIPWKYVCGMRDKLIHDYFGVDLDEVWRTVERDLPELKEELKQLEVTNFKSLIESRFF